MLGSAVILVVALFSAMQADAQPNPGFFPPTVAIVTPVGGATVSGSVDVSGTATTSRGGRPVSVVLEVDSARYGIAAGTDSWSITVDTSTYSAGIHRLTAVATDSRGRTGSTSINILISAPNATASATSASTTTASPATTSPSPSATASSSPPATLTSTASQTAAANPSPTGTSDFVTRSGHVLTLGGKPYAPTGINVYSAYKINLDSALTTIGSGQRVIRAWFFQRMATVNGQRDWTRLDDVLAVARAHGVKVIPVLADQWGASTDGPEKRLPWWPAPYGGDGYRTKLWSATDLVPYRQWVQQVVARYRDDPTIAFWQLINEGEARNPDGTNTEATAREAIHAFAQDVGGLVKSLDPNHLVSLGTVSGEAGSNEADYAYIHQPAAIDIADYHDYRHPYSPMGDTDPYNGLQTSINRIHASGKVIFVGESGIHWMSLDTPTLARRASLFGQKLSAAFSAGVSGYLLWCWDATATSDYDITPGDPSLALLPNY